MGNNYPIGIFDSGVGGLTVVRSLLDQLPGEHFIYFGDTAHVPYGSKEQHQLFAYARDIIAFLISKKVKAIVVACGTHSAVTVPHLKNDYPIPILGVLKAGARSVVRTTHNGKIGVVATSATVKSQAYTSEILQLNKDLQVFEQACPRFVPLVESGQIDSDDSLQAIKEYIQPLLDRQIDSLVLGCTHYPFLAPQIKNYVGEGVALVDPSCETIEELKAILAAQDMFNQETGNPTREFYVSGQDDSFYNVGRLLIGDIIDQVQKINLD